jgi:hypothetical protein
MPRIIQTVEEIIATKFKRQGYWIVFNTSYNDVHAFRKPAQDDEDGNRQYLVEEDTDQQARKDFLTYMQESFPDTQLYDVFDLVGLSFLVWPYLGSIAIDMDKGTPVYDALSKRYNDPECDAKQNNAVIWTMNYDDAVLCHQDRMASIDKEYCD